MEEHGFEIYATGGHPRLSQRERHRCARRRGGNGIPRTLHRTREDACIPRSSARSCTTAPIPRTARKRRSTRFPILPRSSSISIRSRRRWRGPEPRLTEAIEQIDIGGVALFRAAAKNFDHVAVLTHPSQYRRVPRRARGGRRTAGAAPQARDRRVRAHGRIRRRDLALSRGGRRSACRANCRARSRSRFRWPSGCATARIRRSAPHSISTASNGFPSNCTARRSPTTTCSTSTRRCGCSRARRSARSSAATADASCARPSSSIPSRAASRSVPTSRSPCAKRSTPIRSRPTAASSRPTRRSTRRRRETLGEFFLEIVAAPDFEPGALEILEKKPICAIMRFGRSLPDELARELRVRSALGGVLAEDDDPGAPAEQWRVVSRRRPSAQQWHDLAFAWDVVRHVKSNGIVIVNGGTTRGICAGQTNRVSAVQIAGGARRRTRAWRVLRERRLLSVCRRLGGGRRRRLQRDHRAGRIRARRRGHRGCRPLGRRARLLELPLLLALSRLFEERHASLPTYVDLRQRHERIDRLLHREARVATARRSVPLSGQRRHGVRRQRLELVHRARLRSRRSIRRTRSATATSTSRSSPTAISVNTSNWLKPRVSRFSRTFTSRRAERAQSRSSKIPTASPSNCSSRKTNPAAHRSVFLPKP